QMNPAPIPVHTSATTYSRDTSAATSWSGDQVSRTEGRRRDVESALIHTSISTRNTTAPISALEVPITSAPPSPGSRTPLAIAGSSPPPFFGIALPGALLLLAQDSEHRTTDARPRFREQRNRKRGGRATRIGETSLRQRNETLTK